MQQSKLIYHKLAELINIAICGLAPSGSLYFVYYCGHKYLHSMDLSIAGKKFYFPNYKSNQP